MQSALYPLKFLPLYKNVIWGGNKLKQYGFNYEPLPNCGELWALRPAMLRLCRQASQSYISWEKACWVQNTRPSRRTSLLVKGLCFAFIEICG